MTKNRLFNWVAISWLFMAAIGCRNSKQLAYFQDLTDTANVQIVTQHAYQPLKLQADDQVQITISSTSPEAAQFFNLMAAPPTTSVAGANITTATPTFLNLYTVTPKGFITLPVLADMKVVGMTTEELKSQLSKALLPYLKDAVVSIRLTNFKVTVIGEVTRPVIVPVNGERINVLEAIGAAGDMTVYAKRFNVKVMRKNSDGNTDVAHLNFNNSKTFQSEYFQLQQNDVVYVEPNKKKGLMGENITLFIPLAATFVTLVVGILSIVTR